MTNIARPANQDLWAAGNYADVGTRLQIVGEQLAEFANLQAGERLLDVAAGNGNFSLAAARRFAEVTSTDLVPELLEKGRRRAQAEALPIAFKPANAEDLPFVDGAFDVVGSVFGVMFAQDHARAADELVRVCRRQGRIVLACWTPDSFIGQLFRTISQYKPPATTPSPLLWGTTDYLATLFPHSRRIKSRTECYQFRYTCPRAWVDYFAAVYGPLKCTFEQLDQEASVALRGELVKLAEQQNTATHAFQTSGEYLQIEVER